MRYTTLYNQSDKSESSHHKFWNVQIEGEGVLHIGCICWFVHYMLLGSLRGTYANENIFLFLDFWYHKEQRRRETMAKKIILETISASRKTEIVRQIAQRRSSPVAGQNTSRPISTNSTSAKMSSSEVNSLLARVFASVTSSTR
nr:MAG TPA: hypothetical protein [Caudoviricetes sp.]